MEMHPGCTVLALKQSSGHYLLGSNSDDPWDSRTRLVCEKLGKYRFIATQLMCSGDQSLPWANMYTRGLNEKGLGFNYAHVEPNDGNWASESGMTFREFSIKLLSECSDTYEAEKLIRSHPRAYHGNFVMNDRENNAVLFEITTKKLRVVRADGLNDLYLRCNHYISKCMQKWDAPDDEAKENSRSRVDSAYQAYLRSTCKDFDQAHAILGNHVNRHEDEPHWGFSNCNHGAEGGTVSSEIIDTANGIFYYCLGWPCGEAPKHAGQLYQNLSWGHYKAYPLSEMPESAVLVDVLNGIAVDK